MSLRLSKREFEEVYVLRDLVRESIFVISLVHEKTNESYQKLCNVTLEEYENGHLRLVGYGIDNIKFTISSNNWIIIGDYEV